MDCSITRLITKLQLHECFMYGRRTPEAGAGVNGRGLGIWRAAGTDAVD